MSAAARKRYIAEVRNRLLLAWNDDRIIMYGQTNHGDKIHFRFTTTEGATLEMTPEQTERWLDAK